jgi:hypothetical protein
VKEKYDIILSLKKILCERGESKCERDVRKNIASEEESVFMTQKVRRERERERGKRHRKRKRRCG